MLTFKNVSFQYPEDDYAMMENLTFHVERGALPVDAEKARFFD